jgi:hypothetical protein
VTSKASLAGMLEAVPALRHYIRTGVLLNPLVAEVTPEDSSVGGPLLWPAAEAWPVCTAEHLVPHVEVIPEADQRALEQIERDRAERGRNGGQAKALTGEEWAVCQRISVLGGAFDTTAPWQVYSERPERPAGDVAMVPIVQLFAKDLPIGRWPTGKDLLQVLWCPNDHHGPPGQDANYYGPMVELRWRSASEVRDVLKVPPSPRRADDRYLPNPCSIAAVGQVDMPDRDEVPPDLWEQVERWSGESGSEYEDFACLEGWKFGGWPTWRLTDLLPIECVCGTTMRLLLTMSSGEQPDIDVGRFGELRVFVCPDDFGHPPRLNIQ